MKGNLIGKKGKIAWAEAHEFRDVPYPDPATGRELMGWHEAEIEMIDAESSDMFFDSVKLKKVSPPVETVKCWQCSDVSAVPGNIVLMPVFKEFQKYNPEHTSTDKDNLTHCGEGEAKDFPYLLKLNCAEGY